MQQSFSVLSELAEAEKKSKPKKPRRSPKRSLILISLVFVILALALGAYGWWLMANRPAVPTGNEKTLTEAQQLDLLEKLQADSSTKSISPSDSAKILKTLESADDSGATPLSRDEQVELLQLLQNN